jgi:flavorubredoxin
VTTIDEIVSGVFRIATFDEGVGITFNQYLVVDERPTLIHTGSFQLFESVIARVAEMLDPATLAFAFISHFEADECGALGRLREVAKSLVPVGSTVTSRQLAGFGICADTLVQRPDDVLGLGRRQMCFVAYPAEMHLWEGLLAFLEPDRVLFTADLFVRPGPAPDPVVKADAADGLRIAGSAIPWPEARVDCEARLRALDPAFLALGHGPVLDMRVA